VTATDFDLIVVGAGPSGSTAAFAAARKGLRVALVDRQTFPRDKPCGDGIGPGAVRTAQQLGFASIFSEDRPIRAVRLIGPDGTELNAQVPSIDDRSMEGYVVPRVDFDKRILDCAIAEGAEDLTGVKLVGTEISTGYRLVRLQRRDHSQVTLAAHMIVGADGAHSVVRKALGVPQNSPQHTGIAMRAYAKTSAFDEGGSIGPCLYFQFDRDLLPSYGWVFPTGSGLVNLGVGGPLVAIQRRGESIKQLTTAFVDQLRQQGIELDEAYGLRAHHLPHFAGLPRLVHPRAVLIGDAASMINPASGEGIAYGMNAAARLVDALPRDVSNGNSLAKALERFEREFHRTYRVHMASCVIGHRLMGNPRWARMFIRAAQRSPAVLADAVNLLFGFDRVHALTVVRVLTTKDR
jgi:menaquinone-9 beta-reductase